MAVFVKANCKKVSGYSGSKHNNSGVRVVKNSDTRLNSFRRAIISIATCGVYDILFRCDRVVGLRAAGVHLALRHELTNQRDELGPWHWAGT